MKMQKQLLVIILVVALGFLGLLIVKDFEEGVEEDFTVFQAKKLQLPAKEEPVCLIAVGDIMLSRGVAGKIRQHGDFNYPFLKVKDFLKSGGIVLGNLEGPITGGREIIAPEMVFRADPGVENSLKDAGFTILSLANNHTPDFGSKGLKDTFQSLNNAGIRCVGAGETENEAYAPKFIEVKGMKLAFVAYCDPAIVPESYRAGKNKPGIALIY